MTATPKFRRVAAGDYETPDGQFRLVQLDGGATRAWNVEHGNDWIEAQVDLNPEWTTVEDFGDLIVDGAATKRDALALFAEWFRERDSQGGDN